MYSKNDVSQLQEKPKLIQNEQIVHMQELFTFHEKLLTHPVQWRVYKHLIYNIQVLKGHPLTRVTAVN